MTILDRYIGTRFASNLARTISALLGVYVLIDLLATRIPRIIKHNVPWSIVLKYYICVIPGILAQVAPFSVLIAGLFVIGRAAQTNEITAVLSAGVSLRRFILAPLIVAVALAGSLFLMRETIGPYAAAKVDAYDQEFFSMERDDRFAPVSWAHLKGNWFFRVDRFDRQTMSGDGVHLYSTGPDGVEQEIRADHIMWDPERGGWFMKDSNWYTVEPVTNVQRESRTAGYTQAPIVETPEALLALDAPPDSKSLLQLGDDIRAAEARGIPVARARVSWHNKFAQPFLIVVMALLAVPFAVRLRHGNAAVSFGAGLPVAMVYIIIYAISSALGEAGRMSPILAAWFANLVFFAVALLLLRRTPT